MGEHIMGEEFLRITSGGSLSLKLIGNLQVCADTVCLIGQNTVNWGSKISWHTPLKEYFLDHLDLINQQ